MFSTPLFKQSIKSNWGIWLVMTLIMDLMLVQFTSMKEIREAGMVNDMYFGMMAVILPTIYVIVTANKLLAAQVDKGSMAYILSTPTKRSKVTRTQVLFMFTSLLAMFITTTAIYSITGILINEDVTLKIVLEMNLGGFLVALALGGICFMFSGIFNLSKNASSCGGLICIAFVMFNMLKMFANYGMKPLENFKYLTIASLFDIKSITKGTNDWIIEFLVLVIISAVTYAIGSITFQKKDLPL